MDALRKMLAPLASRIANMVARAIVQLVTDGSQLQALQLVVGADETREGCERFQEYGFTSVPFSGAEAVVVFVGGRRDHPLVVAVDDRRHRKTGLQPGEVAIYTDEGDSLLLSRGRVVRLTAGAKAVLDSPDLELGQPASDAALKGTAFNTALATFLGALSTYVGAIKGVADPSNAATPKMTAAITTFTAAASAALSTKVKVG